MMYSRNAVPMPTRRAILAGSAAIPLAASSAGAAQKGDDAIFCLIDTIATLRPQARAAQARAEVRRLTLEAGGAPGGAEQGDYEWMTDMGLSDLIDAAVSEHVVALERMPAAGLAGVAAKLEFAVADAAGDVEPLVRSALDDLRRMMAGDASRQ